MKKLFVCLLTAIMAIPGFAQGNNTRDGGHDEQFKSLWELATKQQKKNDAFNVFVDFSGCFHESINPFQSTFKAKELRLELKGSYGKHLSYRLRHRLNLSGTPTVQEDNFSRNTDIIMVGWRFNEKWAVNVGKMCQIWGGYEYDENPMFIYEYSDFLNHSDIFMAGAMVSWNPVPSHEIAAMVSNSSTTRPVFKGVAQAAHPLSYILNWNGNFFGGILNTRWSVGAQTMAQDKYSFMAFLGQQLALKKFQVYLDYMGSFDQLDHLGIVTADLGLNKNVLYNSITLKANWQFVPKWNLMAKGMYELASADDPSLRLYRQSIGWIGCVEFYPWEEQNLRLSVAYFGRNHDFTRGSGLSSRNGTAHHIEIGIMYRIKAY